MSMKLSADLFNEIVSTLKSDGSGTSNHDKRTECRVGLRCTLDIVPISSGAAGAKPMSISVRDISANGIGLLSSNRVEEDIVFVARFSRDGKTPVPVLYKVKYCRRISKDLFSVGAIFDRVMADSSGEVVSMGKSRKPAQKTPPVPDAANKVTTAA